MTKPVNEREIALAVLMEVTENGAYSHIVLREVLEKYQYLEKRERAFITRVTEGTLEHMIEIDYILDQFSKVKVKKMKPVIRNILRSAVYQLKYMDSVPDRAVCSEAVNLAVRKGFSGLKGYVNGRAQEHGKRPGTGGIPVQRPEGAFNPVFLPGVDPGALEEELQQGSDRDDAARFSKEKPLTIRCRLDRISPEELKKRLGGRRRPGDASSIPALCL